MVRWYWSVLGLLASVALLAAVALWLRAQPRDPARLIVSTRVTHVLTPLRKDGTIDYPARYAPKHDTLPDWNEAGVLAPAEPQERPTSREPYGAFCARPEGFSTRAAWLLASGPALRRLEAAALGDWPEVAPWIRSDTLVLAGKFEPSRGETNAALHSSVRWVVPRLSALRALACRCGHEVQSAPERASRSIQTLTLLATTAARSIDHTFAMMGRAAAREARACGELLARSDARQLLADVNVPAPASQGLAWFLEQHRLRVLDAMVDAVYRFNARRDLDINVVLAAINAQHDWARTHKGEFPEVSVGLATTRYKRALLNPFASATEVRRAKSEWFAEMLGRVLNAGDMKRQRQREAERRSDEEALRQLVLAARGSH